MSERVDPPRIFRVRYRSAKIRKVVDRYVKVPYSGFFGLTETLARAMETKQILWFRIDVAKPPEIAKVRDQLVRWTEFLNDTASTTEVDFTR